jgi:putative glycosyltransferase (TIGR04372 family)
MTIKSILKKIILYTVNLPIIIIIIFFNYFKKIRFCKVRKFIGNNNWLDLYIADKKKTKNFNNWDFFYYENIHFKRDFKKINYTFYNLLSREISLVPLEQTLTFLIFNNIKIFLVNAVYLYDIRNLLISPMSGHYPFHKDLSQTDDHLFYKGNVQKLIELIDKPVINLKRSDLKKFEQKFNYFNELNKEKKDLIVFVNRDGAYKKKTILGFDMSHNSYRDFPFSDFFKTLDYANKKYFIFRGGNIVEKTDYIHKNFIEYASSNNVCSENDVYSLFKCKFFVGTESGLDKIARMFFKPLLIINKVHVPWLPTWTNKTIFMPKKLYDTKKNKFITFNQMFDFNFLKSKKNGFPLGLYVSTNDYKENNIKIIDNTPDEILNAFLEMELFIEKKLILNKEDKELQEKYWKLYPSQAFNNNVIISPSFLRKNITLLD